MSKGHAKGASRAIGLVVGFMALVGCTAIPQAQNPRAQVPVSKGTRIPLPPRQVPPPATPPKPVTSPTRASPQLPPQQTAPRPTTTTTAVQPPLIRREDPGVRRPPPGLEEAIHELWRAFPGKTGIAIRRIDGNWSIARRGGDLFPQQSVSKLWVALTMLDQIDRGERSLTDEVRITAADLTLFHQPIARRVQAEGEVREPGASLMEMAMTASDNTANDSLLRHAGGPTAVRAFLRDRGIRAIRFGPGERLLQSQTAGMTWLQSYSVGRAFEAARAQLPLEQRQAAFNRYLADPIDGAAPQAMVDALSELARGELLSAQSTRYILAMMGRSRTGALRLKAGLPSDWSLSHKTGTGQDLRGTVGGFNDVGIVTAPDGTRYAVAIMLAGTNAPIAERQRLMQDIVRTLVAFHGS